MSLGTVFAAPKKKKKRKKNQHVECVSKQTSDSPVFRVNSSVPEGKKTSGHSTHGRDIVSAKSGGVLRAPIWNPSCS